MQTGTTRHSVYNINYHLVWIPKYRKKVLSEPVGSRLKTIFGEVATENDYTIPGMEVMPDHVHLFVSAPPCCSPAEVVKKFKGIAGLRLFHEFPGLRRSLRKGKLWSRSYYVGTAGTVTSETIKRYIDEQKKETE